MDCVPSIEDRRLALQTGLDAAKTAKQRNQLGQFATPTGLAADVLAYARTLLPEQLAVRFLDPAIGTGAFYMALIREFAGRQIDVATGFEIDPHYGQPASSLWGGHPLNLKLADFTKEAPPAPGKGFNLVICNPPYVRHHHIDKDTKNRLLAATAAASGVQMSGLAGLYCYFLFLSHAWMEPDGVAGWLIPSEFMDVNYGMPVKQYLLNKVELIRIHRFDPNDLQFGDALVSSAVVWFRKRKPVSGHQAEFSYGGTLTKPKVSRIVRTACLQGLSKWTGLATDGVRTTAEGLRLADFFSIKRGLATGDNGFFILTREKIAALELPMQFFKPILPGPRHLDTDFVEASSDGTPKVTPQLFLLD
jgi:predicted RNA methylase